MFPDLLRSVQMIKREWGAESKGSYRTYSSLVKLQPWFLSLPWRNCLWAELHTLLPEFAAKDRTRWRQCLWFQRGINLNTTEHTTFTHYFITSAMISYCPSDVVVTLSNDHPRGTRYILENAVLQTLRRTRSPSLDYSSSRRPAVVPVTSHEEFYPTQRRRNRTDYKGALTLGNSVN